MIKINEGDKVPGLEQIIDLDKLKGKKLILYFYPKDNTPGCTNEALNLKEHYKALKDDGFEVIGVSPDSEEKHKKFIEKFDLPFKLIPDTEKTILNNFGVWGEKKMYGKTYMGVHRTTFIIDENGTVVKIFPKVKTKEHYEQIMKTLAE
ncbi:MAG: thioredoxin-dependent thiol peroxidase [Bacteroidetes bacterium]|nr:MAG: thioredoxin-dependent thiol peroxidase [Bacteroidota bacterium]